MGVAGGTPPEVAKPAFKASAWKRTTCRTVPMSLLVSDHLDQVFTHVPTGKQMIADPGELRTLQPADVKASAT